MKTSNLHIRVTAEWLQKLDYLCKQNGFTSRSAYIKTMVEANYAVDKELGDKLLKAMADAATDKRYQPITENSDPFEELRNIPLQLDKEANNEANSNE